MDAPNYGDAFDHDQRGGFNDAHPEDYMRPEEFEGIAASSPCLREGEPTVICPDCLATLGPDLHCPNRCCGCGFSHPEPGRFLRLLDEPGVYLLDEEDSASDEERRAQLHQTARWALPLAKFCYRAAWVCYDLDPGDRFGAFRVGQALTRLGNRLFDL